MYAVMSEEKKDELDRVTIKSDVLRKYFPILHAAENAGDHYQAAGAMAEKETARE